MRVLVLFLNIYPGVTENNILVYRNPNRVHAVGTVGYVSKPRNSDVVFLLHVCMQYIHAASLTQQPSLHAPPLLCLCVCVCVLCYPSGFFDQSDSAGMDTIINDLKEAPDVEMLTLKGRSHHIMCSISCGGSSPVATTVM